MQTIILKSGVSDKIQALVETVRTVLAEYFLGEDAKVNVYITATLSKNEVAHEPVWLAQSSAGL